MVVQTKARPRWARVTAIYVAIRGPAGLERKGSVSRNGPRRCCKMERSAQKIEWTWAFWSEVAVCGGEELLCHYVPPIRTRLRSGKHKQALIGDTKFPSPSPHVGSWGGRSKADRCIGRVHESSGESGRGIHTRRLFWVEWRAFGWRADAVTANERQW